MRVMVRVKVIVRVRVGVGFFFFRSFLMQLSDVLMEKMKICLDCQKRFSLVRCCAIKERMNERSSGFVPCELLTSS